MHDLHVWNMTAERAALSAHIVLANGHAWPQTLAAAQKMLAQEFAIEHVTLQPDWPAVPTGRKVIPVAAAGSGWRRVAGRAAMHPAHGRRDGRA